MICELIPKEFLIVPYNDHQFFNGSSFKNIRFSTYHDESFTYDSKVFKDLQNCRRILIEYFGNKKLEKIIPKDLIEFYILKTIKNENTRSFYQMYKEIIKNHLKLYQDKLYILPDVYVDLSTDNHEGVLQFKDKFIVNYCIKNLIDKICDARYNRIILATEDDSSSDLDLYIADAEYILNNIPDCVFCKHHNFKIRYVNSQKIIMCDSCGFEIPDLRKFLCCVHAGKKIMKINEK